MAAVKLNVLHLHLTEDQGFRIESRKFPSCTRWARTATTTRRTRSRHRRLRGRARHPRGARVRHARPLHELARRPPELGERARAVPDRAQVGHHRPGARSRRARDVYRFLDAFLGEMAALFPDSYLHIGGDENNGKQWDGEPDDQGVHEGEGASPTRTRCRRTSTSGCSTILQKHGKKMMGWDEILHPTCRRTSSSSRGAGQKSLGEAAKQGYDGILSNGYYIDLLDPASQHYAVDPLPPTLDLTPSEAARVLGGEATHVVASTSTRRPSTRASGRARRPSRSASGRRKTVTDVDDMYRRMALFSPWLEIAREPAHHRPGHTRAEPRERRRRRGGGHTHRADRARQRIQARRPSQEHAILAADAISDTAQPESFEARRVDRAIDGLVADAPRFSLNADNLATTFSALARRRSGDLRGAGRFACARRGRARCPTTWPRSGRSCLEALAYLRNGSAPPDGWADAALARIKSAEAPRAETQFAMLSGMRLLVAAADQRGAFDPSDAAGWQAKVKARADVK